MFPGLRHRKKEREKKKRKEKKGGEKIRRDGAGPVELFFLKAVGSSIRSSSKKVGVKGSIVNPNLVCGDQKRSESESETLGRHVSSLRRHVRGICDYYKAHDGRLIGPNRGPPPESFTNEWNLLCSPCRPSFKQPGAIIALHSTAKCRPGFVRLHGYIALSLFLFKRFSLSMFGIWTIPDLSQWPRHRLIFLLCE
ncbi:hypothetical protein H6P81_001062 [Aristolochia fimbriata]|uniref:Uncharacterized protein n=1 Tax=Aristolochia fimbriata TaxID=158543 RepID=A0AAV7F6J3_ARIFI|nr:hypothetical protein H6P81_001062 [Aristolochia fimbriata]